MQSCFWYAFVDKWEILWYNDSHRRDVIGCQYEIYDSRSLYDPI